MNSKPTIPITLTPEQKEQLRQAGGREVSTLQLKLAELEARLSPGMNLN